jgi:hypothetical protein
MEENNKGRMTMSREQLARLNKALATEFEYDILGVPQGPRGKGPEWVLEQLNERGKEGWEYMGVMPGDPTALLLKRRKMNADGHIEPEGPAKEGER